MRVYAARQATPAALFGGPEIGALVGNPWKVIPFGDITSGLFAEIEDTSRYDVVVPEKAIETGVGLLSEVGLREKGSDEVISKRAVLVSTQGILLGAQVSTPQQAQQLLQSTPSMLPSAARDSSAQWSVREGKGTAPFELVVKLGTTQVFELNNFAMRALPGRPLTMIDIAERFKDKFEARV